MCGIATYVTTNNKQASQLEQLKETENNYDAGITAEDVYKSYEGGEIIKINTADELLKIGSNEQKYINGKIYTFGTNATYELEGDIEFTGDFREVASKIKENNIVINGNDHQIVVTTASGTKEYYTKYSKYYIATNKYGYVLDGLELYYDGIDNTGTGEHSRTATTWKDLSGNNHDGTLNNFGNSIISGWGKDYLSFDGINDWVNCGVINNDYATLDICYMLKSKQEEYIAVIDNMQGGGMGITIWENKLKDCVAYLNGAYRKTESETMIAKNEITSTTLSYDGKRMAIYKDGKEMSAKEYTGVISPPQNSTVMAIGCNPIGNSIDGDMADVIVYSTRIYNRGLTEEETSINNSTDERRYKNNEIIPIYTAEQLLKIGSNEEVTISQTNKKYKFSTNAKYELKNDITLSSDFSTIANRIKNGEIELVGGNYKIIDSNSNYYTEASSYCVAVNKYGYISNGLILYYDGIDNSGSGHTDPNSTWKDLSGNGNDATIAGTCHWTSNSLDIRQGNVGTITQKTTFSGLKSFTLLITGDFYTATATNVWPRIISTNGNYADEYEKIIGLDLSISNKNEIVDLRTSNGSADTYYYVWLGAKYGYAVTHSANWNYDTKKLIRMTGSNETEVTITKFTNINCSQIAMGYGRNNTCGLFRYHKVQLYNRSLSDEEMSVNNRNDKIRFDM